MKKIITAFLTILMLFSLSSCKGKRKFSDGNKIWLIVTDKNYRPFEYENEEGFLEGIDIDLLDAIAKDQGFKYELESLGWNAGVSAVKTNQADGLMAAATIRQSRIDSGWIFSDGYFISSQAFAFFKESSIFSFEDLKGKIIGCKQNSLSHEYAESLKEKYDYSIRFYDSTEEILKDVMNGTIDGCCEDMAVLDNYINHQGMNLKVPARMKNSNATYGFAIMNAENKELIEMFNEGLKNIKVSGKYQEILNKYI